MAITAHGDAAQEDAALREREKAALMDEWELIRANAIVKQGREKQGNEDASKRFVFALDKISAATANPQEQQSDEQKENKETVLV